VINASLAACFVRVLSFLQHGLCCWAQADDGGRAPGVLGGGGRTAIVIAVAVSGYAGGLISRGWANFANAAHDFSFITHVAKAARNNLASLAEGKLKSQDFLKSYIYQEANTSFRGRKLYRPPVGRTNILSNREAQP
jgi:hypothetical protein